MTEIVCSYAPRALYSNLENQEHLSTRQDRGWQRSPKPTRECRSGEPRGLEKSCSPHPGSVGIPKGGSSSNSRTCWFLDPGVFSLELSFQVRPEFLHDVCSRVDAELDAELRCGVGSVPVVRVIGVRNCHRSRVSDYFRIIELRPARISMGPEDLPHGVAEPGPSASSPASKVARVLVEKSGEDRLRHIIADYKIAICGPEIPGKSGNALPETWICVGQLSLAGEQSCQR